MNLIEQVTLGSRDVSALVRKRLLGKDIGEDDARDVLQALQGLLDDVKERMLSGPIDEQYLMTVAAKIEGLKNALGGETPTWSVQMDSEDAAKPSDDSESEDQEHKNPAQLTHAEKMAGPLLRRKVESEDSAAAQIVQEMRRARKRVR